MQHSNWKRKELKLLFVYNTDGGIANFFIDLIHRLISSKTFACNLFKLSHDKFGIKKEWHNFIKSLPNKVEFLYCDEFLRQFPLPNPKLPAIFTYDGELKLLINNDQINSVSSINELTQIIRDEVSLV